MWELLITSIGLPFNATGFVLFILICSGIWLAFYVLVNRREISIASKEDIANENKRKKILDEKESTLNIEEFKKDIDRFCESELDTNKNDIIEFVNVKPLTTTELIKRSQRNFINAFGQKENEIKKLNQFIKKYVSEKYSI